jgi:glycosyltransferase involved in cell wall biosynthesis
MSAPHLSIIVPAYNEEASISDTVDAIVASVERPGECEIVLVNDGSTDGTLARMSALQPGCAALVRIVDRQTNGGLGQALRSGFDEAEGDVLTWIPGDGEYHLDEILGGVQLLAAHDLVLVRRVSRGDLGRNILSSGMYALIRSLFRFDARRYCGIFVVTRQQWSALTLISQDVFFTLEVALRASHSRWKIAYIEAEWHPRRAGRSKVFNLATILRNVRELFRFRWQLLRGR